MKDIFQDIFDDEDFRELGVETIAIDDIRNIGYACQVFSYDPENKHTQGFSVFKRKTLFKGKKKNNSVLGMRGYDVLVLVAQDLLKGEHLKTISNRYKKAERTVAKFAYVFGRYLDTQKVGYAFHYSTKRMPDGSVGAWRRPNCVTNEKAVTEMRDMFIERGYSRYMIAQIYGLSKSQVYAITSRGSTIWKDAWLNKESHREFRDWYKDNPIGEMDDWRLINA